MLAAYTGMQRRIRFLTKAQCRLYQFEFMKNRDD